MWDICCIYIIIYVHIASYTFFPCGPTSLKPRSVTEEVSLILLKDKLDEQWWKHPVYTPSTHFFTLVSASRERSAMHFPWLPQSIKGICKMETCIFNRAEQFTEVVQHPKCRGCIEIGFSRRKRTPNWRTACSAASRVQTEVTPSKSENLGFHIVFSLLSFS